MVDAYPHSLIGLEDLSHIRERTKRKRGKTASVKQRRANRHASQWTFAELQGYLAYKALLNGSMAVLVDAYKTSPCCPRCGYTSPDRNALTCRTVKPKRRSGDVLPNCGGVQTQAPVLQPRVSDIYVQATHLLIDALSFWLGSFFCVWWESSLACC